MTDAYTIAYIVTRAALFAVHAAEDTGKDTAVLENAAYDAAEAAGLDMDGDLWQQRASGASPAELLEHIIAWLDETVPD